MTDYNREKTVIELCTDNSMNFPDFYAQLELPADDLTIYDALQKIRAVDRDVGIEINVINSPYLPELTDTLIDGVSIRELNILAGRLEQLYREDYGALEKLNALFLYQKEQGLYEDGIPMSDLINMTYGTDGIESHRFIGSAEELGKFVVENDIYSELSELSDRVYLLLDYEKVGQQQAKADKGFFLGGRYYTTVNFEMPDVYKDETNPDRHYRELQTVFRMKITGSSKSGKFAGINREICLPSDRAEMDRLAQECGEKKIEDCVVVHAETAIPQINVPTYQSLADFVRLNAIAKAYTAMSEQQRMTFKAVLQREKPPTLDDMIDRARNISDYEVETFACTEPDFFKLYLMHFADSRLDSDWIQNIVPEKDGVLLLEKLKAKVTEYGIVSGPNQPLYRLVPYSEPDESEGFHQTDFVEDQNINMGGM